MELHYVLLSKMKYIFQIAWIIGFCACKLYGYSVHACVWLHMDTYGEIERE